MLNLHRHELQVKGAPKSGFAVAAGALPEHFYGLETAYGNGDGFFPQFLEMVGLDAAAVCDQVRGRQAAVVQVVHQRQLVQQFVHDGRLGRHLPGIAVDDVFYLAGDPIELDGDISFFLVAGTGVAVELRPQ